jgi:hypothetical protein
MGRKTSRVHIARFWTPQDCMDRKLARPGRDLQRTTKRPMSCFETHLWRVESRPWLLLWKDRQDTHDVAEPGRVNGSGSPRDGLFPFTEGVSSAEENNI